MHDFLLVWDWDEARRKSQDGKEYEHFLSSRGVPKCSRTECRCQDYLDKATRLWNFGLLVNRMERYEEAGKNLRKAVELYRTGMALRGADKTYTDHSAWRLADEEALRAMNDLFIDTQGAVMELNFEEYSQTPLSWAADKGHEAVVRLLLDKGAAVDAKDKQYGRTALSWAADKGHQGVVRLLVDGGAAVDAEDTYGQTPLLYAAENGHEAMVRLLIEDGANMDVKDKMDQTPLLRAAGNGYEAIVQLLLEKGADIAVIQEQFPLILQYTCRYWVHHLQQSQVQIHDDDDVHKFLRKHFLHWLEALSLMDRLSEVIEYIGILQSLVSVSQ